MVMARSEYGDDSLISKYINACSQASQPLNDAQIGLLEQTLDESFGIKRYKLPQVDMARPLDKEVLGRVIRDECAQPGRTTNVLEEYRKTNLGMSDTLPITEAEAWSLYRLTADEIEGTTYKELKAKHGLSNAYGWGTFKVLHEYFKERGIIGEDAHFPRPIDF